MRNLILVRHGQSLGNVDESFYKFPDSAVTLTPRGVMQSITAGQIIKRHYKHYSHGSHIYSSSYTRAKQTAEIALNSMGLPSDYTVTNSLNELNISYGENFHTCQRRLVAFYENVIKPALYEQDVILFFHGNAMKSLVSRLFIFTDGDFYVDKIGIDLKNAKPYILQVDENELHLDNQKNVFKLVKYTEEEMALYESTKHYEFPFNKTNPTA